MRAIAVKNCSDDFTADAAELFVARMCCDKHKNMTEKNITSESLDPSKRSLDVQS